MPSLAITCCCSKRVSGRPSRSTFSRIWRLSSSSSSRAASISSGSMGRSEALSGTKRPTNSPVSVCPFRLIRTTGWLSRCARYWTIEVLLTLVSPSSRQGSRSDTLSATCTRVSAVRWSRQ